MKFEQTLNEIIYDELIGENGEGGLIEKMYGYNSDISIKYNNKNEVEIIDDKTYDVITKITWKREIKNGKDLIEINFPDKIKNYPIRNYKHLDLYSLKNRAKETKARTVQSFLLELGLMKEEFNDAKKICNFDLNKDPKKLTNKELTQFHLIQTRRDF